MKYFQLSQLESEYESIIAHNQTCEGCLLCEYNEERIYQITSILEREAKDQRKARIKSLGLVLVPLLTWF